MKRTSKRLLALILALCMALSLLSASVWAAEVSDDLTVVISDGSETESPEAPAKAEPEAEPEESEEEAPEESEPEESEEEAPEESEPEESEEEAPEAEPEESEAEPEEANVSAEAAAEPAEAEPEAEEADEPEQEADESAAEESAAAQAAEPHTHKDADDNTITFQPWNHSNGLPESGNFYLTEDVTLTDTHSITSGTLNLCLNGHSITMNNSGAVLRAYPKIKFDEQKSAYAKR